jgi:hypothetical protein
MYLRQTIDCIAAVSFIVTMETNVCKTSLNLFCATEWCTSDLRIRKPMNGRPGFTM